MSGSANFDVLEAIRADYRKQRVWMKGTPIPGSDPAVWRYDRAGKIIRYSDYGDRWSEFGWEIDHNPIPVVFGGSDDLSNLWPLNCFDNANFGGGLAGFGSARQGGIGGFRTPARTPTMGIGLAGGGAKGGIGGR